MPKRPTRSHPPKRQRKAPKGDKKKRPAQLPTGPDVIPEPELMEDIEIKTEGSESSTPEAETADIPCGMKDYETGDLRALASGKLGEVDPEEMIKIKKELMRREKMSMAKPASPKTEGTIQAETMTPDESGFRIIGQEEADYDPEWYDVFETLSTEWPLLAIDYVIDRLGASRTVPPHTLTMVGATQEEDTDKGHLELISLRGIDGPYRKNSAKPVVVTKSVPSNPVTRLRTVPMWDVGDGTVAALVAAHTEGKGVNIFSVGRAAEGISPWRSLGTLPCGDSYAIAWGGIDSSRSGVRALAYGSEGSVRVADIEYLFNPTKKTLAVTSKPHRVYKGWDHGVSHGTIEDIAFRHEGAGTEAFSASHNIFATCGTDGCVGLWDTRMAEGYGLAGAYRTGHKGDINVLDWADGKIITGGEDGVLMLWDVRTPDCPLSGQRAKPKMRHPVHSWSFHKGPITSVAFSPHEECVFYACSDDGALSVWNYDCEADGSNPTDVPQELVFLHQGLKEPRELRPHPQIPGLVIVTGLNGVDIFKGRNVGVDHMDEIDEEEEDGESSGPE